MDMSKTVPGADQAIAIGALNHALSVMLERPAAIEMAKTQDENTAVGISMAWAA